jgi:glycosyltransferase involved in cell wall biosynthesis
MPQAMSHLPLVSFIMPVYNRANVIERALDGILRERAENYPNLEVVVIDGGSKDGTVEILKRYGEKIDYWVSEKDSGAAEAFNKGVKAAKGEIIRYVASDDGIVNGFTKLMVDHLVAHADVAVAGALANSYYVDTNGKWWPDLTKPKYSPGLLDLHQAVLWTEGCRFSLIESWFIRRSTFNQVGYLDIRYRICPDWDFALRVVKSGLKFEVLPHLIVDKCLYDDGSNLVADGKKIVLEGRSVVRRHAGLTLAGWIKLYNLPEPLHKRIWLGLQSLFFSPWLAAVKKMKSTLPGFYIKMQSLLKK